MYLEIGEEIRDNGKPFGLDCRGRKLSQETQLPYMTHEMTAKNVNLHPCHAYVGAQGKKTFVFVHRCNS